MRAAWVSPNKRSLLISLDVCRVNTIKAYVSFKSRVGVTGKKPLVVVEDRL